MTHCALRGFIRSFGVLFVGGAAAAQCPPDWLPADGNPGITGNAAVMAATVWDPDGSGPREPLLVVGGTFNGAGDVAARNIAAWDGTRWSALGAGLNNTIRDLDVYNGELVAAAGHSTNGGPANGVARWDGSSWVPLGSGFSNTVTCLAVHNGSLVAAGLFSSAGGAAVNNIARWSGSSWQPMGPGISPGVLALTVHNGELYAGMTGVHRWTGAAWQPVGAINGSVESFGEYNGELIAGGGFTSPGGRVARWDGAAWRAMGTGMNDAVWALAEYQGLLFAGGIFTNAGGATAIRLAQWNGSGWAPLPGGMRSTRALVEFQGELIIVGAGTKPSGNISSLVLRWNGTSFGYLGSGFDAVVYSVESYKGELIAGGWFSMAGDAFATGIARRDSSGQWHPMGDISGGDQYIYDIVVHGDLLVVSGSFTSIGGVSAPAGVAQWDGVSWAAHGNASVQKKLVHEGVLYGAGNFGPTQKVARWNQDDGVWEPIGSFPSSNLAITCLTMFQGDLVAGGIGGIGVNASVWRWDFDAPGAWQPVGQHLGYSTVETLGVYNGELLAGGYIGAGLMRFDGISWVPLGGGLFLGNEAPDEVLAVFDLHILNNELIVAGTFSYAGAQQYTPEAVRSFHVVRWNGTSWLAMGEEGTDDAAVTLAAHNGTLVIGGWFEWAGTAPAGHVAYWGAASADFDCDGDVGTDSDIEAFFACLGGDCPASPCAATADFDGDGDSGTDLDIETFFRVLGGGPC